MRFDKIMNNYLHRPLLWDGVLIAIGIGVFEFICSKDWWCLKIHRESLDSLLNELVSSSLSVGGFVIASLTIVVTIKDGVSKPVSESENGLDALMNGKWYPKVVNVFKVGAWIFILTFLAFSLIEVMHDAISNKLDLYLIMTGLIYTVMALIRCLLALNVIINLQIKANNGQK